jgi:23S rRNA (uracil1939-C5)-methyltransferase
VIEGEHVSAEIVREKKQFAEAELIEVKEASVHRVPAPCPYFGRCGGCAYQHMDYAHQLATKDRQVRDVLRRIGKIDNVPFQPIIASPNEYDYRNRITVHAQDGVVGFFRRDSHRLIDIEYCPISREEVNRKLAELRASNPRDGHYTLRASGRTRAVASQKDGDTTARVLPRIFSQTNDAVAEKLRDLIDNLIPPNQSLLVDAFCGAGFFAKALLPKFERVIGIDWDKFAIHAAITTATDKENYIAGNVDDELRQLREASTVIVDPPAAGLTDAARKAIVDLAPEHFVYVSCNPATLARDLKDFRETFDIRSVTPLDMFPQTAEIEVAVRMTRYSDV